MAKLIEDHTTYTATFRMLAQKHKALLHLKTGADDVHFVRCVLSKHPMLAQGDLDEFLKGIRNVIKVPFMLLVAYSTQNNSSHQDAKKKALQGEFFIFDRYEKSDWDARDAKLASTEKIGEEIMSYLVEYYEENPQDGQLKWDEGMTEPFGKTIIDNLAGNKFYFTIEIPNQVAMEFDADNFEDLTIE